MPYGVCDTTRELTTFLRYDSFRVLVVTEFCHGWNWVVPMLMCLQRLASGTFGFRSWRQVIDHYVHTFTVILLRSRFPSQRHILNIYICTPGSIAVDEIQVAFCYHFCGLDVNARPLWSVQAGGSARRSSEFGIEAEYRWRRPVSPGDSSCGKTWRNRIASRYTASGPQRADKAASLFCMEKGFLKKIFGLHKPKTDWHLTT